MFEWTNICQDPLPWLSVTLKGFQVQVLVEICMFVNRHLPSFLSPCWAATDPFSLCPDTQSLVWRLSRASTSTSKGLYSVNKTPWVYLCVPLYFNPSCYRSSPGIPKPHPVFLPNFISQHSAASVIEVEVVWTFENLRGKRLPVKTRGWGKMEKLMRWNCNVRPYFMP